MNNQIDYPGVEQEYEVTRSCGCTEYVIIGGGHGDRIIPALESKPCSKCELDEDYYWDGEP